MRYFHRPQNFSRPMRRFTWMPIAVLSLAVIPAWAARPRPQAAHSHASLNSPRVNARAEQLLRQMTLAEKISMLSGHKSMFTHAIPRLGIPALKMSDASVGVRVWGPSTAYPASVALAATWNPGMAYREGHAIGRDSRARGVNIILGPGMDITREPQCGRNFEYLGEDPHLAGTMAAAWIRGLQSMRVAACAKHYAGNEQEYHRGSVNSIIGLRALEEIYLAPFRAAVKQGGTMNIMAAYNRVNGAYSSDNRFLLINTLRHRWHYKGVVMSDWGATHSTALALNNGLDLEMPSDKHFSAQKIMARLKNGQLTVATLNRHVLRLLREMVAMHFIGRKQKLASIPLVDPTSAAVAEQVESQAAVLLKNRGGVLPLAQSVGSIVVVGPDATPAITGGAGSALVKPNIHPVSLLAAVRKAAGPGVKVSYIPYPMKLQSVRFWWRHRTPQAKLPADLLTAAQRSEIQHAGAVIAAMGPREGEGWDRNFHMPGHQDRYLAEVGGLNPHTIVVIDAGANVAMSRWIHQAAGLVYAWYPGENGNTAIAGILFGTINPSGHLPDSFEKHWKDAPAYGHYPGHDNHVHFAEGIYVGYRWYDSRHISPRYPFGFGLSYTSFRIAPKVQVSSSGRGRKRILHVTASITNTGQRAGADVVQLYVRPLHSRVRRTFQQLRAFQRVELAPGQTKQVHLRLHWRDFAYFDVHTRSWRVPPGSYGLAVGDSSRHIAAVPVVRW